MMPKLRSASSLFGSVQIELFNCRAIPRCCARKPGRRGPSHRFRNEIGPETVNAWCRLRPVRPRVAASAMSSACMIPGRNAFPAELSSSLRTRWLMAA
ncbi:MULTISPECIES: hypothetical protein [unclassified Paracoccus (in: a-proteobacteria)]|uniref:hypothetical protein n=1 Tax=unclassified Paracoccus (in: a-proteobacteria) TaxID=2688777 RepID=UPI0016034BC8|nr:MULTISPECIES: hypothetical protein [unclassified Paracoccus (in: a-proteobacteria)]MBB1490691.1 hypothetical protein [Paracoccus sp. MC1854]MBB1497466.1 hypothetical protein [Paracoccus sp. MC1862]QQO46540.1 hypothetical protein JGR78_06540 [Paracoccus sp. MC1862]